MSAIIQSKDRTATLNFEGTNKDEILRRKGVRQHRSNKGSAEDGSNKKQIRKPVMADPSMTVCEATSIPRMQDILHEKKDLNTTLSFQIIHYPGATHSIPNLASEWFTHDHEPVVPMENQKKQYMDYNRFIKSIYWNQNCMVAQPSIVLEENKMKVNFKCIITVIVVSYLYY